MQSIFSLITSPSRNDDIKEEEEKIIMKTIFSFSPNVLHVDVNKNDANPLLCT